MIKAWVLPRICPKISGPGTPNNPFKMDVWLNNHSYVKIWNRPIETTIYKTSRFGPSGHLFTQKSCTSGVTPAKFTFTNTSSLHGVCSDGRLAGRTGKQGELETLGDGLVEN